MKYASIVVFRKLGDFDTELTYSVSQNLAIGDLVQIPFRSKLCSGIVTGLSDHLAKDIDPDKLRDIDVVLRSGFLSPDSVSLARKMSGYYQTSISRVLRLFLSKNLWNGKLTEPSLKSYQLDAVADSVRGEKQLLIIDALKQAGSPVALDELRRVDGFSMASLKSLVKKGIVTEVISPEFIAFDHVTFDFPSSKITLTEDQEAARVAIADSDKPVLLHGVTGSGKTEIYLRLILEAIKSGKQAILLVPEIGLTPQMIKYFDGYFGKHVALFHSKLTDAERAREWWKVKNGYAPLAIGSRSAIFAPADHVGLVIIDEEHEWTYKQESTPYYQTQWVAEKLCELKSAQLLLGSATPSAETYYKSQNGLYNLFHLPDRISQSEMPAIEVVDLREEFKKKNFSIFSRSLQNKIADRLVRKEQIILFVNQRGMASAVACRDCGYTEECPNCEISLKLHRYYKSGFRSPATAGRQESGDRLVCHYCTYTKAPEIVCPECSSPHIRHIGVGTQRVEDEVAKLFPQARVVRADRDTTQSKKGFEKIYHDFLDHQYDILIGTQMVAKGLDFSKVSLIGIVLADIGLHRPDFRSSERLFQILTQVAGRCGRGEQVGEVVLQTYNPDHPTIKMASEYQYDEFIQRELKFRSQLNYPPYNRMVKFTVVGMDPKKIAEHIQQEQEVLEDIFKTNDLKVKILSAPAIIPKMANRYYYHVLIRSDDPSIVFKHWKVPRGWRVDVDPVNTA